MTIRTPFDEMNRTMAHMMEQMEQFRRSMHRETTADAVTERDGLDVWTPPLPSVSWRGPAGFDSNLSVEATEDGYAVYADVPGFERDEFELTFDGGVLTVEATHEVEAEHSRRSRSVHERVTIPGDVVVEECTATYRNGVLEVLLPTATEPTAGHHIDVE